jgi:hypothetical protein
MDTAPSERDDLSEIKLTQWVNKNAFFARLFSSKILQKAGAQYAIWTLRDTLEEEEFKLAELWESHVAASGQWIMLAGKPLFDLSRVNAKDEAFEGMTKPGKLFLGPPGLSLERWSFWKSQFQQVSIKVNSTEVKSLAMQVANQMDEIEQM